MSELEPNRNYNDLPGAEVISDYEYQNAVQQLICNCCAVTSQDQQTVEQPEAGERGRTAVLEPQLVYEESEWHSIEVTVFPKNFVDHKGDEVIAYISLTQQVDVEGTELVELVKNYEVILDRIEAPSSYRVETAYELLFDGEPFEQTEDVDYLRIANVRDVESLDDIISSASR